MSNNPIMRLMRPLLELDRLQRAYPYEMDDASAAAGDGGVEGKHYYLVAYGGGRGNDDDYVGGWGTGGRDRAVIGFCDVDGRIVGKDDARSGPFSFPSLSSLLPLSTSSTLRRPLPYLSDLVVRPNRRRRGLASRLLDEAERLAGGEGGMGYDEMYLCIRNETDGVASDMYKRRGYEVVEPVNETMVRFVEAQDGLILLRRSLR
ncbi:hypothetical protein ACHAXA_006965 [Cyclostephanos tholiformis]|uniref:N-acetyltransferase domain-containing protein n=1 Tax=Cyclostephanos tholiformis TaxID=382380 RepID=A0ABD3RXF3_9STRA